MKKLLIIDDDPSILKMLSWRFRSLNYEVVTAEDGEQGHLMAAENKPDIIVLDMHMPEMNGLETLSQIRYANEKGKEPPVILYTGEIMSPQITSMLKPGEIEYFSKTDGIQKLANLVEKLTA